MREIPAKGRRKLAGASLSTQDWYAAICKYSGAYVHARQSTIRKTVNPRSKQLN
jgi:hypothetical protein